MKKTYIALLIAAFTIPSISFASIDANLRYGSHGIEVTELQEFLINRGFLTGQTSGNFFSLTRKAVIAYQVSVGLPATGFVGPMTRVKINAGLSVVNTTSTIIKNPVINATTTSIIVTSTNTTTSQTNTSPKYLVISYKKNIDGKSVCGGSLESVSAGDTCTQLLLESYLNSSATVSARVLDVSRIPMRNIKVSFTMFDGSLQTEKKTDEYGIASVDISSKTIGNGYLTVRTENNLAKDLPFYVSSDKVLNISDFSCTPPEIIYNFTSARTTDSKFECTTPALLGDQGQELNKYKNLRVEYWVDNEFRTDYHSTFVSNNKFDITPPFDLLTSKTKNDGKTQEKFNYKVKISVDNLTRDYPSVLSVVITRD